MIIKNLTSKLQELEVEEIIGTNRSYKVYLEPYGSTELEGVVLLHKESLKGIIDIGVNALFSAPVDTKELSQIPPVESPEESGEEEEEDPQLSESLDNESGEEEEEGSQVPQNEDKFICDVCGAEFASARGLTSHKNRAHTEE